jgi:hypothetical protein
MKRPSQSFDAAIRQKNQQMLNHYAGFLADLWHVLETKGIHLVPMTFKKEIRYLPIEGALPSCKFVMKETQADEKTAPEAKLKITGCIGQAYHIQRDNLFGFKKAVPFATARREELFDRILNFCEHRISLPDDAAADITTIIQKAMKQDKEDGLDPLKLQKPRPI